MGYESLQACLRDLEAHRQLRRIEVEIDPDLEAAAIQRRVYQAGGPALFFARARGCAFPLVSNLFGTLERARFLFRDALDDVHRMVELRVDPAALLRHPSRLLGAPASALRLLPRTISRGPVQDLTAALSDLPRLRAWPRDGGPFVTLPMVYTEDPEHPGVARSNLGMYRIQLAGNDYGPDEVGLHYQLHRGIGVHHAAALRLGRPLHVNVFVGGPPALAVAAVMPLPEGLSELGFAGLLGGRRVRLARSQGNLPLLADADFCISGVVDPAVLKPEGPFGDHLGYYSLTHDFPVLKVKSVSHRRGAVWPFTVVGRPPQEDTTFGALVHELTGPLIPSVVTGVKAVHAVDASGVHPLLLAVGSERYVPYEERREPREILTQAHAILGQGQMSLAKYLFIAAGDDAPSLDPGDVAAFFRHVLERMDPARDLHFETRTTIDTLDYSGSGFNRGSKVVIAAAGPRRRDLPVVVPGDGTTGFTDPRLVLPGILALRGPAYEAEPDAVRRLAGALVPDRGPGAYPLVVVVDDAAFAAESLRNFLWVTFTRSDPAHDIAGVGESVVDKHWGCRGAVIIDARVKPHHAPPLEEDPAVTKRVESLAAPGAPLHGLF